MLSKQSSCYCQLPTLRECPLWHERNLSKALHLEISDGNSAWIYDKKYDSNTGVCYEEGDEEGTDTDAGPREKIEPTTGETAFPYCQPRYKLYDDLKHSLALDHFDNIFCASNFE